MWEAMKPVAPVTRIVVEDGGRADCCDSELLIIMVATTGVQ